MKIIIASLKNIMKLFRLHDQPLWLRCIFLGYLFVALCAPILANKEPLLLYQNGSWTSPAFQQDPYLKIIKDGNEKSVLKTSVDWTNLEADFKLFAPVPYDPSSSDIANSNYVSPFEKQWRTYPASGEQLQKLPLRYRHWLGTTKTGADVLSGLIYSTRISLLIGFMSMLVAALTGIIIGSLAGFYGDKGLYLDKLNFLIACILIVPAWFYIFILPESTIERTSEVSFTNSSPFIFLKIILFIFILLLPFTLKRKRSREKIKNKGFFLPVDSIVSRFIELFLSVPRLILIITLSAISRPSVLSLILILGLTSWTGIARMVRGEFIKLRSSNFTDATNSLGFSPARKIVYHLLPNAFEPIRVGIIFGIAGAILAEAGLSFLGIGLSPDTVTWGSMLASGREQFSAWWLVIFPGLAISLLLMTLNKLSDEKKHLAVEKLL
ncbi:MAG TPA: ABC transporter permease [Bacteroidia bacterium]|nr:ABC transporter permease [Bacteroidia bacterium]HNS13165.1 ABC transporter permease [Bacteroidia bacterium]